jgi:hypothetical protein
VHAQFGVFGHRLDWHRDPRGDDDLEVRAFNQPERGNGFATGDGLSRHRLELFMAGTVYFSGDLSRVSAS